MPGMAAQLQPAASSSERKACAEERGWGAEEGALAERMWEAGSLVYSSSCLAVISLFTVFQKLNADGTWKTRPVWDLRPALSSRIWG